MSICSLSFVKISTSDPKKKPSQLVSRSPISSRSKGCFFIRLRFTGFTTCKRHPGNHQVGSLGVQPSAGMVPFRIFQSRVTLWNWEEWPTLCPSQPAKNLGKVGKRKNALATMSDPIFPDSRFLTWTTNWPKQRPSSSFKNPIWLSSGLSSLTGNAVSASR